MPLKYFRFGKKNIAEQELSEFNERFVLLTTQEQKQFRTYLRSPFFCNDKEHAAMLYTVLLYAHNRKTNKAAASKLIKEWKIEDRTDEAIENYFIKKIEELHVLLFDFLSQLSFKQNTKLKNKLLVASLKDRGASAFFPKLDQQLKKQIEQQKHSLDKLRDELEFYHQLPFDQTINIERDGQELLALLQAKLDQYYHTAKAIYACGAEHLKQFSNLSTTKKTFALKFENKQNQPDLKLLYDKGRLIILEEYYSKQALDEYAVLLKEAKDQLEIKDYIALLTCGVNALSKQIKKENADHLFEDLFEWKKKLMDQSLKLHAEIRSNQYLNLVNIVLNCKKYELTLRFIEDYKVFLIQEEKEKTYGLALANYYLEREYFEKAKQLLETGFPSITKKDFFYTLRINTLKLRVYVELEWILEEDKEDLVSNMFKSFKRYLTRNRDKLSVERFEEYTNFLTVLSQIKPLYRGQLLRKKEKQQKVSQLLEQVDNMSPLPSRRWLKKIIKEA